MTTKTLRNTFLAGLLIATTWLLGGTLSQAGKKPGGGGGGGSGDTGGGTIYFYRNPGDFSSMDSNGGSKTSLGINQGEPSYALHAGQRWFLQDRTLPGEFYPNGSTRRELFAVRVNVDAQGNLGEKAVQLTDQPSLQVRWHGYRWTPGDENVSWTGRRWDELTGTVVEGGIYGAEITFGDDGDSPALIEQPANPLVPVELVVSQGSWEAYEDGPTLAPNVGSYSWSPLAAFVVYRLLDYSSNRELWIADPVSGAEFQLSSHGGAPEWSPDGGKIVYVGFDGIETINPDGTNRKVIISADTSRQMIGGPHWSPSGSHLTYLVIRLQGSPNTGTNEVYRATATGGGKTSLTKDTDWARPVAWR